MPTHAPEVSIPVADPGSQHDSLGRPESTPQTIGSSVFAGLTAVSIRHTNIQRDHETLVAIGRTVTRRREG